MDFHCHKWQQCGLCCRWLKHKPLVFSHERLVSLSMALTIAGASSGASLPTYLAGRMGSGYSTALRESVSPKLENVLALATNSFAVRPVPEIVRQAPHRQPATWTQHPTAIPSLDRIDSDGHYESSNVQLVCRFINLWKQAADDAEFRRVIMLVRGDEENAI